MEVRLCLYQVLVPGTVPDCYYSVQYMCPISLLSTFYFCLFSKVPTVPPRTYVMYQGNINLMFLASRDSYSMVWKAKEEKQNEKKL